MAIGLTEWGVIGGIIVLLFGAPAVIKWAKAAGEAKKAYKEAMKDEPSENKEAK